MSEFEAGIDQRIELVRAELAKARAEENDYLEELLISELESLIELAERNDLDTGQMKQVLTAETGAIPIIEEPGEPGREPQAG